MPQKSRNNKRKNQNKQATQVAYHANIPRAVPLPQSVRVTLRYTDIFQLDSTSGIATYVYSGNAVTSPDPAFPTDQPFYFDRYQALYNQYVVLGAKIDLRVTVDTGSNQCVALALFPYYLNNVTTSIGGLRQAMEIPYSKHTLLVNNPVKFEKLNIRMKSATLLSTTDAAMMNDPDFWAETTVLPLRQWFFKIIAANVDSTTTAFGLAIEAALSYDVVFKQWQDEGLSKFKAPGTRKGVVSLRETNDPQVFDLNSLKKKK